MHMLRRTSPGRVSWSSNNRVLALLFLRVHPWNQVWADQDHRGVLHKFCFCSGFFLLPPAGSMCCQSVVCMHANLCLLPFHTSCICCRVQREPCSHVSLHFLLTCTISLLKGCCVVSNSWDLLYLLSEITAEQFWSIGTFNTWDLASLENDLISCFLSRSLCGPVRAAAAA